MPPPHMLILLWFNPSEAYLEDPRPFFALINAQKSRGCIGLYEGNQLRSYDDMGTCVVAYKSAEHHQRFTEVEEYAEYAMGLMDGYTGQLESVSVLIPETQKFAKVLTAPATEFSYMKLYDPRTAATLLQRLATLDAALIRARGYHGATWGPCDTSDDVFVWISGWDSVDGQLDSTREKTISDIWAQIRECACLERKYASLRINEDI